MQPIVIDLGKAKRRKIRDLKAGHGALADEVTEAVAAVRRQMGDAAATKELVPVVVLYRKKSRKRKLRMPFPF